MKIFVDTDVVISSLLSSKGAAFILLHANELKPIISSYSKKELKIVGKRLDISEQKLMGFIQKRFSVIEIQDSIESIKASYKMYVTDIDDTHIVAGAHKAEVTFLISYNIKHYRTSKIKENFNIILMTPGQFIQYLRSLQ